MQSLQKHAPEMKEIQRKYKGDRQKLNEEMMKFYRENNINPAASCLPLLAQVPVFISLYFVLENFSKHVPPGSDLSWLHIVPNITAKANSHWSGYVLLAIYAGSQVLSTYFMSQAMDKTQRRLMMVLPLVFITRHRALPDRPRHLLGDDEPVDGRPGPRHAPARARTTAAAAPAGPKRSSRTPRRRATATGNGAKTAPSRSRARSRAAGARSRASPRRSRAASSGRRATAGR